MNWPSDPATESQPASFSPLEASLGSPSTSHAAPGPRPPVDIKVGKRFANLNGKDLEVFTMTLGGETIELLPLRNWGQLDIFKWRVRGKLPGTPAGLEITFDHIKLLGETVSPKDEDACAKLERLFGDWLAMERETLELAKKKVQLKATTPTEALPTPEDPGRRFKVEVDKEEQVHIQCIQGKETLAMIGLNPAGFQSLVSQGLMRKPHALKTGALHDWVELDGVLYSFEKGNNDAARLEKALNDGYLPPSTFGRDKEVVVFANAASSTGFDIQFPAKAAGTTENRRRPLAEESLELLQDVQHCGLLQKGLVIKLSRPTLIFKVRTPEGGERYLDRCAENLLKVSVDEEEEKVIDLSQPVNYLHLSAMELTAVFNHPSINRHAKAGSSETTTAPRKNPAIPATQPSSAAVVRSTPPANVHAGAPITREPAIAIEAGTGPKAAPGVPALEPMALTRPGAEIPKPSRPAGPPNLWIEPLLAQPPIRFDWFSSLVYEKIASWAGNSQQDKIGERPCWYISLSGDVDLTEQGFKGIFLTEQGAFGFCSGDFNVTFENGSLMIGSGSTHLTAEDVRPLAIALDSANRVVFLVNDAYRSRFKSQAQAPSAIDALFEHGAVLMSVKEALGSKEPLEVIWTAPVEESITSEHKAIESHRPTIPVPRSGRVGI